MFFQILAAASSKLADMLCDDATKEVFVKEVRAYEFLILLVALYPAKELRRKQNSKVTAGLLSGLKHLVLYTKFPLQALHKAAQVYQINWLLDDINAYLLNAKREDAVVRLSFAQDLQRTHICVRLT